MHLNSLAKTMTPKYCTNPRSEIWRFCENRERLIGLQENSILHQKANIYKIPSGNGETWHVWITEKISNNTYLGKNQQHEFKEISWTLGLFFSLHSFMSNYTLKKFSYQMTKTQSKQEKPLQFCTNLNNTNVRANQSPSNISKYSQSTFWWQP